MPTGGRGAAFLTPDARKTPDLGDYMSHSRSTRGLGSLEA